MAHIDPLLERNRHFAIADARESAILPPTIAVSGHVYDVATGLITTILPAAPMHSSEGR
jgi:hypothetical protein